MSTANFSTPLIIRQRPRVKSSPTARELTITPFDAAAVLAFAVRLMERRERRARRKVPA